MRIGRAMTAIPVTPPLTRAGRDAEKRAGDQPSRSQ